MLIKDVLQKTTLFFRDKGIESARLDSEMLIASALNWERMKLYLNYEYPLSENELTLCRELVRRRALGEPVAYILGKKDFYNHTFIVNSSVLIPRPETEQLVEVVISWLKKNPELSAAKILDIGAGTGCIGLSILAEIENARLIGVEISSEACLVAELNAKKIGLEARSVFIPSDIGELDFQTFQEQKHELVDVVVANPPYIAEDDPEVEKNVRKFEPACALFSEASGLGHIQKWAGSAAALCRPGALVIFEIGHKQGAKASEIFANSNWYKEIKILRDLSGRDRFVQAIRTDICF